MASNTFSLSIAAISSSAILFSNTKTSFTCQQPHERTFLSSSLIATRTSIYKNTSTTRPTSLRKGSRGLTCSASSSSSALPSALLFDCDGVLVDTEKDGHRISFNDTFKEVCILSCSFLCSVFDGSLVIGVVLDGNVRICWILKMGFLALINFGEWFLLLLKIMVETKRIRDNWIANNGC